MRTRGLALLGVAALLVVGLSFIPEWSSSGDCTDTEVRPAALRGGAPGLRGARLDAGAAGVPDDPDRIARDGDGSGLFPPPDKASLAAHLREIANPSDPANTDSLPPYSDTLMEMRADYNRAYRSVRALADAGLSPEIDQALIAIARTHEAWDSRCRAARALLLRRYPDVSTILTDLIGSPEAHVRYIAWRICWDGERSRESPPPVAAAWALRQYSEEGDADVAEEIELYLGVIQAKAAIPALMERVKKGPASKTRGAAAALGMMKVREAVPLLIETVRVTALGRIGTPAAVACLLNNLDRYGAADALVDAGDKSVVPALEAALAKMRALPEDHRHSYAETPIYLAIVQLRHDDPAKALMDLIEDRENDDDLRESAAARLRMNSHLEAGQQAHEERLASIYLREESPGVRGQCLDALEDSRARGVTRAMLNHAMTWKPYGKTTHPTALLWHLNRRLGTSFKTVDDVKRYVEAKRAAK